MFLQLYYCIVVLALLTTDRCRAWSYTGSGRSDATTLSRRSSEDTNIKQHGQHQHHATIISSRREVCKALITTSVMVCSRTFPANADVTNKVASSTALRSLDIVQRQLPIKLLPLAQSNDYIGVKKCLREPPFDTLRKDMLTIVRGGEDGKKVDELLLSYKQLIKSLEAIDATSSLGMRKSSNIDPFVLGIEYEDIAKSLDLFIRIGSEAAAIPLQEVNTQTKIGGIDVRSGKIEPRVL